MKSGILYNIGISSVRGYLKLFHGFKVIGIENVPVEGGLIIVCNHISHLDPPALGVSVGRRVRFVAKQELFEQFFLKWYLPAVGVIPLKRGGGGKVMLDTAADAIKAGDAVVLFPEGTRSKTGMPGHPRTGFIVLTAMSGAPVLPMRISGSYDCMPPGSILPIPGKIQIVIGKPIHWKEGELNLHDRDQMQAQAEMVFQKIFELPGWHPRKAKKIPEKSDKAVENNGDGNL